MEILVAYDVNTTDNKGKKRLRKVAQACQAFGQRVQNSVFECTVSDTQLEQLSLRLADIIDSKKDNLRIYRLREPKEKYVTMFGIAPAFDIEAPLVI